MRYSVTLTVQRTVTIPDSEDDDDGEASGRAADKLVSELEAKGWSVDVESVEPVDADDEDDATDDDSDDEEE